MRRAKIGLLAALFLFLAACMIALPLTTPSALAAEGDSEVVYTYTKEEISFGGEWNETHTHYYIDDIEGGFGELIKNFDYPASYNISANVKSQVIYDAFLQIAEADGVSLNYYNTRNYLSQLYLYIFNNTHVVENATYSWLDDVSVFKDLNTDMESKTVSATDDFEVNGDYVFIFSTGYSQYIFHYKLSPVNVTPVGAGSLIYLSSYYTYNAMDSVTEHSNVGTFTAGEIFSTDPNSSAYIVESVDDGLPASNYTMTFIYDGKAEIEGTTYSLYHISLTDTPYTVQGKLTFTTTDGETHTLYTNIVTIQKHTLDMRLNTTKDYRVGVGVENEYSFIFDSNNIEDYAVINCEMHFEGFNSPVFKGDDSLKIKYTYDSVGEKEIVFSAHFAYNGGREVAIFQSKRFSVSVLEDEPEVVMPEYKIDFNLPEVAYAVYGGTEFTVSAAINEFYGDEHFETEIALSGNSLSVLSTTDDSLILFPLTIGRSAVVFTAVSSTAGEFTASIIIEVIASTDANTEIVFDEAFNLTGSNVVARLAIGGVTEFVNYAPTWSVKVESGDSYTDVTFVVDSTNAAVLESAASGYYQFAVSGNGISSVETIKRVSDINMAEVAEKVLPYLALIMVLFIAIVIFLRLRAQKNRTLIKRLQKTQSILDSAMKEKVSKASFNRTLKNLIKSMGRSFTAASERDLETLGLYQNLCSNITKSIQICEAGRANSHKMGKVLTGKFMKNLKKHYVDEAVRMCIEIDESLDKFAKTKAVAVTVAPDSKKSGIPDDVKFKAMLSKFYHQGDDVDGNNRSGDDDRDDNDKSEG